MIICKGSSSDRGPVWWLWHGSPWLRCPKGHVGGLNHEISETGRVTPSVQCMQEGCDFHAEDVVLAGWQYGEIRAGGRVEVEALQRELDWLRSLLCSDKKSEELAIENKLYKLLARELAAELRRWFEYRPLAWRFDPSGPYVHPPVVEREGFLALHSSAAELLSRPEVEALMEEEA